jgi:hypothetical protein
VVPCDRDVERVEGEWYLAQHHDDERQAGHSRCKRLERSQLAPLLRHGSESSPAIASMNCSSRCVSACPVVGRHDAGPTLDVFRRVVVSNRVDRHSARVARRPATRQRPRAGRGRSVRLVHRRSSARTRALSRRAAGRLSDGGTRRDDKSIRWDAGFLRSRIGRDEDGRRDRAVQPPVSSARMLMNTQRLSPSVLRTPDVRNVAGAVLPESR